MTVLNPTLPTYGWFRMSNVSAYTASTQLGEGEDVVHWKTVDSDTDRISGRKKINRNYPLTLLYLFFFLSTHTAYILLRLLLVDNSNRALKLAIENFQIRCAYTFYTVRTLTVKAFIF